MSRARRRREIDIFNLSFLDVVSCGFGAIILLLVIVKISEPLVIERRHGAEAQQVQPGETQMGAAQRPVLEPRGAERAAVARAAGQDLPRVPEVVPVVEQHPDDNRAVG